MPLSSKLCVEEKTSSDVVEKEYTETNSTGQPLKTEEEILEKVLPLTPRSTARKRRPKKKENSGLPFPHTYEARDSLLDKMLDRRNIHGNMDPFTFLQNDDLYGLVNLGVLVLLSATLQLILSNYSKHGFLADFSFLSCLKNDFIISLFLFMGVTLMFFTTYLLQLVRIHWISAVNGKSTYVFHVISLFLLVAMPTKAIVHYQISPLVSAPVLMYICVLFMKMHSYFATNSILAQELHKSPLPNSPLKQSTNPIESTNTHKNNSGSFTEEEWNDDDGTISYPNNVNFASYCYFLLVPTLVYEANYPRSQRVRYWYALKEFIQIIGCFFIAYVLFLQFILPVIKENENFIAYDLLRMAIPSIIIWLLGFYALFHCLLNCIAELLHFADRQFYLDWWNAISLDIFWRKWNLLVHEWLLRHVYLESIQSAKASKKTAVMLTFLASAIMHEFVFAVAFHALKPWFFLGMFFQVPLIIVSQKLVRMLPPQSARRWGNIFVWCSLFLGQPLIELLYMREYICKHQDLFCYEKPSIKLPFL